ncbi:MAG TPA: FAD-dependent oxidoreductase [Bacteroidia bacterium]|jgi:glycine/D-amino acid oxidase-like deaminating enzyme/nitrite reductase/ring-hydroxylating ferredoxin subunit
MTTRSIWEGTAAANLQFPSLRGEAKADVVIIGGGITGLTAAMLLSEAGKKVIVLEALQVGKGTTGNSTGNLYVTVDEHLSGIRKKWSTEVMRTVVQSREAAIDLIENRIKKYSLQCDFFRTGFNYFSEKLEREAQDFIQKESEAIADAGLIPNITENPPLPFPVKKMLSVEGQAQFHPLKYAQELAKALQKNCIIHEHSKVIDYNEDEGTVRTGEGTVKADHIIMATHTPKGVFALHMQLGPYREHGVAAKLSSGSCPQGIFWGIEDPKHSVRAYKDHVMVIGDKFKTGTIDDNFEYINGLKKYLRDRFETEEISYVWGGQQYRPADALPYIGKHGKRMYILTGFATDGLVYGTLGAMIIADQVLGKKNPFEKIYDAGRSTPMRSAGEFIKENAGAFAEYVKDMPWNVDEHSIKEIKPGEGKIIGKEGEKVAVYKDETGKAHIVSAVCTHMKCIVNWNNAEKTWDCPCHGSRFGIDGKVLEGPAIHDLPNKK